MKSLNEVLKKNPIKGFWLGIYVSVLGGFLGSLLVGQIYATLNNTEDICGWIALIGVTICFGILIYIIWGKLTEK
ncbi:MAG: hypothetical protein KKD18_00455 [Nanoarchaeota archaeon]|nr:hypothetical protein [Nanoarchaeota archaeon]